MQDLLSSSYCVRLGRLRFRTENKATGEGGGGARGRQQTEEVSTHTPCTRTQMRGTGRREGTVFWVPEGARVGVGEGGSSQDSAAPTLVTRYCEPVAPGIPGDSAGGTLLLQLAPLPKVLQNQHEIVAIMSSCE